MGRTIHKNILPPWNYDTIETALSEVPSFESETAEIYDQCMDELDDDPEKIEQYLHDIPDGFFGDDLTREDYTQYEACQFHRIKELHESAPHQHQYNAVVAQIKDLQQPNSKTKLYRFLSVPSFEQFTEDLQTNDPSSIPLRESWTIDDDMDLSYLTTSDFVRNGVRIEGVLPTEIDQPMTVFRGISFLWESEHEMVLKSGSEITVQKICRYGDLNDCREINRKLVI